MTYFKISVFLVLGIFNFPARFSPTGTGFPNYQLADHIYWTGHRRGGYTVKTYCLGRRRRSLAGRLRDRKERPKVLKGGSGLKNESLNFYQHSGPLSSISRQFCFVGKERLLSGTRICARICEACLSFRWIRRWICHIFICRFSMS